MARLGKPFAQLDPFVLKQTIESKLKAVLRHHLRQAA
jgi:hypothetical protein